MPRVLRILNRLAVGGPVLNATYLTKYLQPEFETILVVGEKENHEKSADYLTKNLGIDYVTIPGMGRSINPVSDWKAFRSLEALIKSFKPDIVHTHAAKPGTLGRLAADRQKVPVILHTFHGHVFHSYFNSIKSNVFINIERYLAKKSTGIIAISEMQKSELIDTFHITSGDKLHVIPLGFDLDRFRTNQEEKRKIFRSEFNLDDDEIAIGITGRLVPVKNHYLFLKAVKYVFEHTKRKVRAFIIGDGETRSDLEQIAREAGMAFSTENDPYHKKPIVFTSWRSDIDYVNAGLDIICLTSFNEGTPVSLIEAQAANKPIVSTRVGGISDIVIEGKTGLLSELTNQQEFCEKLLLLVEDEKLRYNLSVDSHIKIMERYSYQRLIKDMSQLYHELLAKSIKEIK